MDQLFGTLELRSFDEEARRFTGIANTAALDSHGTIIEPSGARFVLPMPLLFHHDQSTPVGEIDKARLVDGKWHVEGWVAKVGDPGFVKDITDRAWHNAKHRLMRGLSVGFAILKQSGNRITEWAWREVSLVTIPSNQDATIMSVRSAFGATDTSPGVSGNSTSQPKRKPMKTIQERIAEHEASVASKLELRNAITSKAGEEGRTLADDEQENWDTLDSEIRGHNDMLTRLRVEQADLATRAVPVNGTSTAAASTTRGGTRVTSVRANRPPGIGFARYVMGLVNGNGSRYDAARYVKEVFGDDEVSKFLETRASVAPGDTTTSTWAAELVQTNFLDDFLELIRPATIIGRIPNLRRVPFNISMPIQTAGGTYNWVGEGAAKPLTKLAFDTVTLDMAKAAGIIVITEELARSSRPSAQELVRNDLRDGIVGFLDVQFTDPAVAAVSGVSPASITNGVSGTAASGTDSTDAWSDLANLMGTFKTSNLGIDGVVLLMNEAVAFTLSMMLNSTGARMFPDLTGTGGTIAGRPVVASNAIDDDIFAVHAPSILVADDGAVDVAVSREASLQMADDPDNPADGDTVYVSMFQRNLVALRGERYINWKKARTGAVARIHTVAYAA